MTLSKDLKPIQTFRRKHIFIMFLCSGVLYSTIYRFSNDAPLAALIFLLSIPLMYYTYLGGFTRGLVIQSAHGGSAFPPSNLDSTGHYGIRAFNAWQMLKEERKINDYNRVVGDKHFEKFIKELRAEKTEEREVYGVE